ncbi:MAG TPA: substrate-binding domain-containing protein [Tepidisphaeraceae bacterium]|nr:substrate-binding domain-containing protein [Tepidisphaeraceae bacterium]
MPPKRANSPPKPDHLRVAVRVAGWSQWQVQVIRGVQAYAHQQPRWRLYVDGTPSAGSIFGRDLRWDGIITREQDMNALWRKLMRAGRTKIVSLTSAPVKGKPLPTVRVGDHKTAQIAGRHLIAGGFRRLAYVGPLGWGRNDFRGQAIVAFANAEGVPCDIFPGGAEVGDVDPWNFDSRISMNRLTRWIARLPKPVGIFTWNMTTARVAAETSKRARCLIPEQVGIVAGDDEPTEAEHYERTLTGIVLPAERLGFEAAKLLDDLMSGGAAPKEPMLVEPSGVTHVRQSSDVSMLPDRQVHPAVQFIREHASQPLSVPRVARAMRMSRSNLDLQFTRVLGHTPRQEIALAHIERAKQLLLETNWPIERIAPRAGFGSWRQFYRTFVQREGLTPAVYRARYHIG